MVSARVLEEVVREYAPVGKYRVRLLRNPRKPESPLVLDVREYVSAESFEGFTRRGVRIQDAGQIKEFIGTLQSVLEDYPKLSEKGA